MSFLTKIDANGRRSTVNSCAGEPGGPAATAMKIAWSLNSWDEAWQDRGPIDYTSRMGIMQDDYFPARVANKNSFIAWRQKSVSEL